LQFKVTSAEVLLDRYSPTL